MGVFGRRRLFQCGTDTVVYIDLGEPDLQKLKDVGRGHLASDSVSIKVILDALKEPGVEVARICGVIP
jgi:hypothetical protein